MWPGHGLPLDASMNQLVEGEYMKADEYDRADGPSDYNIRINLPRTTGLFESFKKLPPLRSLQSSGGSPPWPTRISAGPSRPDGPGDENKLWQANYERDRSSPWQPGDILLSGAAVLMAGAPFDHFADFLRGTRGISMDMIRQPQKLHEAMERWLNMTSSKLSRIPHDKLPDGLMPLHKGDDTFMSDKQFAEFYWPYLRKIMLAMVEEGLVPMPFAEGKYTNRLKQIADTPKSAVLSGISIRRIWQRPRKFWAMSPVSWATCPHR